MRNKIFVLSVVLMIMIILTCKGPVEEPVEEAEKATEKTIEQATLRSQPEELTQSEVSRMVRDKGFHCPGEDIKGTFSHQYEVQTLNGQKVVVDRASGLMWQQAESERMDWKEVEAYIEQCNTDQFAGFSDWRLPTVEELASLLESKKKNQNFIDPVFQKDLLSTWTSDTVTDAFAGAWFVDFAEGKAADCNRAAGMGHARLVRSH